ncbi:MAG: hypothetical protein ACYC18_06760 [Gammaproteobacteria bacterium]
MRHPHLLAAVSFHGFGHLAQSAPVINELRRRIPRLRLTVYCAAPRAVLESRIEGAFQHWSEAPDVGMVMDGTLKVCRSASARAYADFHRDWEGGVAREAERLACLAPDLILADVPYRILSAAARAGIPAVALCSLNWGAIYRAYCGAAPEAPGILAAMDAAYRSARAFLAPEPALSMDDLPNHRAVGPIGGQGRERRAELRRRVGLCGHGPERLVLVAPGGIPTRLPMDRWPLCAGLRWLVPAESAGDGRADRFSLDTVGMPFLDLLCSCDALITKPGYGAFVEAACGGVPVLYVRRRDWPEEPGLTAWLARHNRCREITLEQWMAGDLEADLQALWEMPVPLRPRPVGIEAAADVLAGWLSR